MNEFEPISNIRRDYGTLELNEEHVHADPLEQFKLWFAQVLQNEANDPTAMVLSTVDHNGLPDSRVVLLKGIEQGCFIFYTNYHSTKALQITSHPYVALNFYWPQMARQVRIRGEISKVSTAQSDKYFSSRPLKSQISAHISPQSHEISNRAFLEDALNKLIEEYQAALVPRPEHWGGYRVIPDEIEFWQGRDNRLHDRIHFFRQGHSWAHRRLAP